MTRHDEPSAAHAQYLVEALADKGVEALWAKGKGGGFWIKGYRYVSVAEAEFFALTGRWPAQIEAATDVFDALAKYIRLLQDKSMFFSSPGYDGPAEFLKHVREADGCQIVFHDGFAQRLDLESPWRTLAYYRFDPWPCQDS
jgi:hypothetical protein